MRVIVQVSSNSSVTINALETRTCGYGYVLLVGFTHDDNEIIIDKMINKIKNLRILPDNNDKQNLSIINVNGDILSISQFTLYANLKKGNRPSYQDSLEYNKAEELYNYFNKELRKYITVVSGDFGSNMKVSLTNLGPTTVILDSNEF